MYNHCVDKLGLRSVHIDNNYDKKLDCLGYAEGRWNSRGELVGNLAIKIKQVLNLTTTLDTIAHELVHIKQYVDGTVYFKGDNRFYAGAPDHYKYSERQTEREAIRHAAILTRNFIDKYWDEMSLGCKLNIMYFRIFGE